MLAYPFSYITDRCLSGMPSSAGIDVLLKIYRTELVDLLRLSLLAFAGACLDDDVLSA